MARCSRGTKWRKPLRSGRDALVCKSVGVVCLSRLWKPRFIVELLVSYVSLDLIQVRLRLIPRLCFKVSARLQVASEFQELCSRFQPAFKWQVSTEHELFVSVRKARVFIAAQ